MKYLVMFTAMVLACCLCCGFIPSEEDMDIYENTVRLHVIANSDSEHDQSVKLLVRDRVLAELNVLLAEAKTQDEATAIIESNLDRLRTVCNETLEALGEEASVYQSLQIKLGEADGQNWWCVLFPTLCTSAAKTEEALVKTGFTSDQIGVLTSGDRPKYKMKFKIMEFFGENFSE